MEVAMPIRRLREFLDSHAVRYFIVSHSAAYTAQEIAAGEKEFAGLFPECEIGAMPPFGNLFGMDVYVSEELAADDEIAFNAGAHNELLRLSYEDYKKLVHPKVAKLSLAVN